MITSSNYRDVSPEEYIQVAHRPQLDDIVQDIDDLSGQASVVVITTRPSPEQLIPQTQIEPPMHLNKARCRGDPDLRGCSSLPLSRPDSV